ncbi:EKC/KEOPS complex subunit GON7 isoform 2-T2 [Thomomys bottae]
MELVGEYVGPDGEPRRLRVSCEASGDADRLQSLSSGVVQMKELVVEFFGSLVQREAQTRVASTPDDDALDALDGEAAGAPGGCGGAGRCALGPSAGNPVR